MPIQHDEDPSAAPAGKLFYESSNGDRWYLGQDPATGSLAVKHIGNVQSGGHISYQQIERFLSSGTGPEHQALRRLADGRTATILIAYDIHPAEGPAYDQLSNAIQALGVWWHHLETVWIVQSAKTPQELRDQLKEYIGPDDQLLILDITGDEAACAGVSDAGSKWLAEKVGAQSSVFRENQESDLPRSST